MARTISLKKNFMMNMLLTVSQFLFPLISFQYASRILLPEGTGKVSFAASVVSYFLIISRMGIPTYGIRACATVRDDREKLTRTVHELLIINLFMSVVAYAALFAAVLYVPKLYAEKTLYLVISIQIFLDAVGVEWLYKALEQYGYITIRSIMFKLISLVAMFALIHTQDDYVIYGAVTIFAASASNLFNFFRARRMISMRPVAGYHLKRHFRPILIFFAMACATTIYTHLDSVMLGFMATDTDVGYYNAAVRIRSILVSVVTSLGVVLLPRASYYIEKGKTDEFLRISRKAINFVFVLAVSLTVYFILFARQGIYFLSGSLYFGSVRPLQIIMPTVLLVGITNILGIQMLVSMGKERVVFFSEIAGALIDLIINALLIPHYTSVGAAIGTLAAELAVLTVQYYALRGYVKDAFGGIQYWKILIAGATGVLATFWMRELPLNSFAVLTISGGLFFSAYIIVLLLLKESMVFEITKQILGRLIHRFSNKEN